MRGVTLEEISSATRIATRFLDALETEHWDRLPGGVFNRGFVRSTAQFLGLDPEAMLAEYTLATTDSARPAAPVFIHSQSSWTPRTATASRDFRLTWVALIVIAAIAAGGWLEWRHVRRAHAEAAALAATSANAPADSAPLASETSAPAAAPATSDAPDATSPTALPPTAQPTADSPAAASGTPSTPASASDSANDVATTSANASAPAATDAPVATPTTPPASAPASVSGPLTLKIEVGRATTVSVSVDGHKTFRGKIPAGGSRSFQASQVFFVTARDAGGVLLELNGQTLPPLGPPGHSANIRLTRESLKSQDGTNH
jgi:cytoskeleton protein RodZ